MASSAYESVGESYQFEKLNDFVLLRDIPYDYDPNVEQENIAVHKKRSETYTGN